MDSLLADLGTTRECFLVSSKLAQYIHVMEGVVFASETVNTAKWGLILTPLVNVVCMPSP